MWQAVQCGACFQRALMCVRQQLSRLAANHLFFLLLMLKTRRAQAWVRIESERLRDLQLFRGRGYHLDAPFVRVAFPEHAGSMLHIAPPAPLPAGVEAQA